MPLLMFCNGYLESEFKRVERLSGRRAEQQPSRSQSICGPVWWRVIQNDYLIFRTLIYSALLRPR